MWELRASYNCDLYGYKSAGTIIISQVLFAKFPSEIKRERMWISGSTYPPLSTLLKETSTIVKRILVARKPAKILSAKPRLQSKFKPELVKTSTPS